MNTHTAIQAAGLHATLKDRLLAQYPELAEDEQSLFDTLDGLTELQPALIAVLRSRDDDLMLVEGIKARVAELGERLRRIEERADNKRAFVTDIMDQSGLKKIEAPDFTVTLGKKAASVIVTDEAQIPADYFKEKTIRTLDKTLIKQALQDNFPVPGANLSNGGVQLTVRKK